MIRSTDPSLTGGCSGPQLGAAGTAGRPGVGCDAGGGTTELEIFVTAGLGDNSYLLASGDQAVLIDPQRDAGR
ncbi:MAG TPA: hypothetical protein VF972_01180, partial [Actinomycetota bacterium]